MHKNSVIFIKKRMGGGSSAFCMGTDSECQYELWKIGWQLVKTEIAMNEEFVEVYKMEK